MLRMISSSISAYKNPVDGLQSEPKHVAVNKFIETGVALYRSDTHACDFIYRKSQTVNIYMRNAAMLRVTNDSGILLNIKKLLICRCLQYDPRL
jgi:hypothetical protein